jgi:hypothetical protein
MVNQLLTQLFDMGMVAPVDSRVQRKPGSEVNFEK